jgi:hypothetical protein
MASILKVDTIQDQAGNNIISENANVITIGASGDTITVPAGATVSGFTSAGIDDNATSTAITIDSLENVGIGTTNPAYPLEVLGDHANNPSALIRSSGSTPNIGLQLEKTQGTGNLGNWDALLVNGNDNTSYESRIRFTFDSIVGGSIISSQRTGSGETDLRFYTTDAETTSERMRIIDNGNVGIGTSSPDSALNISRDNFNSSIQTVSTNYSLTFFNFGNTGEYGNQIGLSNGTNILSSFGFIDEGSAGATGIYFTTGNSSSQTERLRIKSNGNVGIGTNPSTPLDVKGNSSGHGISILCDASVGANIRWRDSADSTTFGTISMDTSENMRFTTNGSERMFITSGGDVCIGRNSSSTVGETLQVYNNASSNVASFARQLEGTLINLRTGSQNGAIHGTISISGTTCSYNAFTGSHWSRFTDNSTPTILRGTVLETLDEMCDWYNLEFDVITQDEDGNDVTTPHLIPHVLLDSQSVGDIITYNHEGTDVQATIVKEGDIKHMKSKVSDTVDAKNVYGVFLTMTMAMKVTMIFM